MSIVRVLKLEFGPIVAMEHSRKARQVDQICPGVTYAAIASTIAPLVISERQFDVGRSFGCSFQRRAAAIRDASQQQRTLVCDATIKLLPIPSIILHPVTIHHH